MNIREVNSHGDFFALADRWNDLLQQCNHSIFSSWEWISTWWKHFGKGRSLRLLIAQEKDKVLGIAPLMLSKYRFLRVGTLRKIEFIGSPNSDYNDIILLKDERSCVELFLNYLTNFSSWDVLDLQDISERSASVNALQELSSRYTPRLQLGISNLCPFINLSASKGFMDGLSGKMRRNLRRRMQKLCKKHKVEFKTQNDFASIRDAMEIFFRLHQKRWQSKGKEGKFASREIRDFHVDLAETFHKKGWLALHFLTADGEPVAAEYSFDYNLRKYSYLTGFDPDFGSYSVAKLLTLYVTEDCVRRGFMEYDLCRGFERDKMDWTSSVRKNFVVKMANKGLHAHLFSFVDKWCQRAIDEERSF